MFRAFKLVLTITVERKRCSHHIVWYCKTEGKAIYDVNMAYGSEKTKKFWKIPKLAGD